MEKRIEEFKTFIFETKTLDFALPKDWGKIIEEWIEFFPTTGPRFTVLKENPYKKGFVFAMEEIMIEGREWEAQDALDLRAYKNRAAVNEFFDFDFVGVLPILDFHMTVVREEPLLRRMVLLRYYVRGDNYITLEEFLNTDKKFMLYDFGSGTPIAISDKPVKTSRVEEYKENGVKKFKSIPVILKEPIRSWEMDDYEKVFWYYDLTLKMDYMQSNTMAKSTTSIKLNPDQIFFNMDTYKMLMSIKNIHKAGADEMIISSADINAKYYYENLSQEVYIPLQTLVSKFHMLSTFSPSYSRVKDKGEPKFVWKLLFFVLLSQVFEAWFYMAEKNSDSPNSIYKKQKLSGLFRPIQEVVGLNIPLLEFGKSIKFDKELWISKTYRPEMKRKAEMVWNKFYVDSKIGKTQWQTEDNGLPLWLNELRDVMQFY